MTVPSALVLVVGALLWALLDHRLRVERMNLAARYAVDPPEHPPAQPTPDTEDRPMSMSDQQLRTLGLNHVRRRIAAGDYTEKDIERWTDELGSEVREMVPKPKKKRAKKKSSTSSDKE